MRLAAAAVALIACLASGAGWAQINNPFGADFDQREAGRSFVDKGEDWKEGELRLPAYPSPDKLIEYEVKGGTSSFRYFIDAESIAPGKQDGIVRYTFVARSSSGVENVSFNGLRCKTAESRLYANARSSDKAWAEVKGGEWKPVDVRNRPLQILMRDFFCPGLVPIMTRAEGVQALKAGYHVNAISNQHRDR